jgi:hypothetical protein
MSQNLSFNRTPVGMAASRVFERVTAQMKLNETVSFSELSSLPIPDAIKKMMLTELSDAANAAVMNLSVTHFDVQTDLIANERDAFILALTKTALLTSEDFLHLFKVNLLRHAAFLHQPQHTLTAHIFAKKYERSAAEIELDLDFFSGYPYLTGIMQRYLERKQLPAMNAERFQKTLAEADEKIIAAYSNDDLMMLLQPLYEFAELGGDAKLSTETLLVFFREKKYQRLITKLQQAANNDMESLAIHDVHALLTAPEIKVLSPTPVAVPEQPTADLQKTELPKAEPPKIATPETVTPLIATPKIEIPTPTAIEASALESSPQKVVEPPRAEVAHVETPRIEVPPIEIPTVVLNKSAASETTAFDASVSEQLQKQLSSIQSELQKSESQKSDSQKSESQKPDRRKTELVEPPRDVNDDSLSIAEENTATDMPPREAERTFTGSATTAEFDLSGKAEESKAPTPPIQKRTEPLDIVVNFDVSDETLRDLRLMISMDERKKFIKKIFKGKDDLYDKTILDLNRLKTWREASLYIDRDIFQLLGVDEYASETVRFVDIVFERFQTNKV